MSFNYYDSYDYNYIAVIVIISCCLNDPGPHPTSQRRGTQSNA